ncbi:MAG: hypothetical protein B7Z55_17625, partial [Planctomycetales bacterium 12-60-4]
KEQNPPTSPRKCVEFRSEFPLCPRRHTRLVEMAEISSATPGRLASLDQFRGYTMFGMLLVNFLGGYEISPRIVKHSHDYCSYADTIMPQFLFAAGFALRLSVSRRIDRGGGMPWGRIVRRILGLALLAIVWYSICGWPGIAQRWRSETFATFLALQLKRSWFQTLLHIAATSLWIVPVITASASTRVVFAASSGLLHLGLSWWFNFLWVNTSPKGIDGGPLGFLSWSIPAICGTLAYDLVRSGSVTATRQLVLSGLSLMSAAWLLSNLTVLYNVPPSAATLDGTVAPVSRLAADPVVPSIERVRHWDGSMVEPPFVPPPSAEQRQWNYWMMSQRCGSLTYVTFAAGWSLVVYAGFRWITDGL